MLIKGRTKVGTIPSRIVIKNYGGEAKSNILMNKVLEHLFLKWIALLINAINSTIESYLSVDRFILGPD